MITIRELADSCGVSVRTLRYYDQIDLLKPSDYHGRIRMYDEAAMHKLKSILAWKMLGLKLEEIVALHKGGADHSQLLLFLEQKKEQAVYDKDELLERRRQVDNWLYHINQCTQWNPSDYKDILSMQNQERPYSLKTHLFAVVRGMTLLKIIILFFYIMDAICMFSLIIEAVTLLFF